MVSRTVNRNSVTNEGYRVYNSSNNKGSTTIVLGSVVKHGPDVSGQSSSMSCGVEGVKEGS